MRFFGLSILLLLLGLFSCEKPQDYSPIPEVEHVSTDITIGTDTLDNEVYQIAIRFSFVDGDGDLGLSPSDTLGDFGPQGDYYYNLKFSFWEKINGEYILTENIKPYYRFQNISKSQTTNNVLKGEMVVEIELTTTTNYQDSSKFDFFIYDRALNKSNVAETSEIYLND